MASGNVIVAEDVGQTREFARPGENAFLVSPGSAEAFAAAMAEFLRRPAAHDGMAAASRAIATQEHTIEHFASDIESFWNDVLKAG
jgi:glycosyltransferase involved in cell wall biosynthesis